MDILLEYIKAKIEWYIETLASEDYDEAEYQKIANFKKEDIDKIANMLDSDDYFNDDLNAFMIDEIARKISDYIEGE